MSLIIKGMEMPKHAAVNGEKDTAYKCVILARPDNSVELVIDTKFASAYDNGHNIQRYPITEIPTPHGRLIDADNVSSDAMCSHCVEEYCRNNCECFIENVQTILSNELITPTIIEAEVSEE